MHVISARCSLVSQWRWRAVAFWSVCKRCGWPSAVIYNRLLQQSRRADTKASMRVSAASVSLTARQRAVDATDKNLVNGKRRLRQLTVDGDGEVIGQKWDGHKRRFQLERAGEARILFAKCCLKPSLIRRIFNAKNLRLLDVTLTFIR